MNELPPLWLNQKIYLPPPRPPKKEEKEKKKTLI
jgi:hypothetical protein